jgi:pyridoxal phosphate enzyme (YggS family)
MTDEVANNLHGVLSHLPEGVKLVAISKFHPAEKITSAYNEGQRVFGESHEQEIARKVEVLPNDIEWHFIGHLQTNKVKYIAPYISMIESADSLKLIKEINKQAIKNNRVIDILLELHIAEEATKYGFSLDDVRELLSSGALKEMTGVRVRGLMMMASNIDDKSQIAKEFDVANEFFKELKRDYFMAEDYFDCRSWGMSHDYDIAVEHGSNMVRVGTAIFGEREY